MLASAEGLVGTRTLRIGKGLIASTEFAWALPAVMYAAVMLPRLIEPLAGGDSVEVTSHDGHVWWTGDIHTASALVALFTMLFVTVLALVRVSRSPALH